MIKVPKKWAYECKMKLILPEGEWTITGFISVKEMWDIESIPFVFTKEEKTTEIAGGKFKSVITNGNSVGPDLKYIYITMDEDLPFAGLKLDNADENKINAFHSSLLPEEKSVHIKYMLFDRFTDDQKGELLFYSQSKEKVLPINVLLHVGMADS